MRLPSLALLVPAAALAAALTACQPYTLIETDPRTYVQHQAQRPGLVQGFTLVGQPVGEGDTAPGATLVGADMKDGSLFPAARPTGRVRVLVSVPSLDTPVCQKETREFHRRLAAFGDRVEGVVVSMDLPMAQKRFCAAEGIQDLRVVSDFRHWEFGLRYGVRLLENGLLTRAVFVVGADGRITYREIVPALGREPDYAAALAAVRKALEAETPAAPPAAPPVTP